MNKHSARSMTAKIAFSLLLHPMLVTDLAARCVNCHGGIASAAAGEMEEQIREIGRRFKDADGCILDHGGDPVALTMEQAHAGAPEELTGSGGLALFHRDPHDIRIADRTCGQCHLGYVERLRKSVMSTRADSISRNLCAPAWNKRLKGADETKTFGRYSITDEDGAEPLVGSQAYKSFMLSLQAERPEYFSKSLSAIPSDVSAETKENDASCRRCHKETDHSEHGMSCSSCHMRHEYYQDSEPAHDNDKDPRLVAHPIQGSTTKTVVLRGGATNSSSPISLEACFSCHFDPRLAGVNPIGDAAVHYGDLHEGKGRGLWCQDCHTSIEMHGDGNIATANAGQMEVRCEDCHGTTTRRPWDLPVGYPSDRGSGIASEGPRGTARLGGAALMDELPSHDGYLLTSRGNPFGNVVRDGDRVLLYSVSEEVHEVTLLARLAEQDGWSSELSRQAKAAPNAHDSMACLDCHADWLPPCLGCHQQL